MLKPSLRVEEDVYLAITDCLFYPIYIYFVSVLKLSTHFTCGCCRISPVGVDLVLDCLCGDDANKGYSLLKPMGKYILYGTSNIITGETKSLFSLAKSVRMVCIAFLL